MFQGADIDSTDCKGHSPLLLATSCGAWRSVNLLLSHGNLQQTLYEDSPRAMELHDNKDVGLFVFWCQVLIWRLKTRLGVTSYISPSCSLEVWRTFRQTFWRWFTLTAFWTSSSLQCRSRCSSSHLRFFGGSVSSHTNAHSFSSTFSARNEVVIKKNEVLLPPSVRLKRCHCHKHITAH